MANSCSSWEIPPPGSIPTMRCATAMMACAWPPVSLSVTPRPAWHTGVFRYLVNGRQSDRMSWCVCSLCL